VQRDRDRHRVHIHGSYPDAADAGSLRLPDHQITAAASRGPAAIAADITRRLLPGYRTDLAKAWAHTARLAREDAQRGRLVAHLLATIPGATASGASRGRDTTLHWYSDTAGSGTIRLWGSGATATIELSSVPARLALTIAAAIRAHQAGPLPAQAGPEPSLATLAAPISPGTS
jgi:hypothetical protein